MILRVAINVFSALFVVSVLAAITLCIVWILTGNAGELIGVFAWSTLGFMTATLVAIGIENAKSSENTTGV